VAPLPPLLFYPEDTDVDFKELALKAREQKKTPPFDENHLILCFDPGHTTGWACFQGTELIMSGQIDTTDITKATAEVSALINRNHVAAVVIEDYRVYKWRAKHHAGSDMLTTRVIGCIETLCIMNGISNIIKQPAHIAKGFCTDTRLKEWGFYVRGERHARDAIRHGCYFLLFGAINKKQRQGMTVG
jgi:hypothetical protein